MTRRSVSLACVLLMAGATLSAQAADTTTTTTTKIRMQGGEGVTLRGCVEATPDGGYLLTHVRDKAGVSQSYVLVSTDEFFPGHVGQRVEVRGKLADRRHGRVDVVSETTTGGVTSRVETDARSDASAIQYLGADHMKTIATFCP